MSVCDNSTAGSLVDGMRVLICVCAPKDYDKILDDESEDRIVRVMRITAFED